jgi:hypothetical protein
MNFATVSMERVGRVCEQFETAHFAGHRHTRNLIAVFCCRAKKWVGAFAVGSRVGAHKLAAPQALQYRATCKRTARRGEYNAGLKKK